MPRKSAAELAIVRLEPHLQPSPPADLSPEQASEFKSIVASMPRHWFGRESTGLLAAYVRHVSNAKLIAAEIDAFQPDWLRSDKGLARFEQLNKMQDRQHRAMALLASKMRLSQSSRTKLAKSIANGPSAGDIQPWDFAAEPADASEANEAS